MVVDNITETQEMGMLDSIMDGLLSGDIYEEER